MKIFFRCKFKNGIIDLKNYEVIKYEYRNFSSISERSFSVKVTLDCDTISNETIQCIRDWSYETYDCENFYRNVSFGIIFNEKITKEIIFTDAHIYNMRERFDYIEKKSLIALDIIQKEDKAENVTIFPEIISKVSEVETVCVNKENLLKLPSNILHALSLKSDNICDLETENVKLFKEKIEKQSNMIEEYKQILIKKFAFGSENAQNLFLKYVPDNSVGCTFLEKNENDRYMQNEKYIKMDFQKDLKNPRGAGVTYFHEHGHLIDLKDLDISGDNKGIISYDTTFAKLLRDDFEDCLESYRKENNLTRDQAYSEISKIVYDAKYNAISDLFGAISYGSCKGYYGHTLEYWNARTHGIQQEAVAHFFEAQFDKERLGIIKAFFPKSSARFDKIVQIVDKFSDFL